MDLTDRRPVDTVADETGLPRQLYFFIGLSTLFGAAHHIDHIIRGNHVGWPLIPEVTAFTYSLVVYPLIVGGLVLTLTDRVGAGYWTVFFTFSTVMLTYLHLSPWAIEPPGDVIHPYASPLVGWFAFVVLLALILSVALGAVYAAFCWYRGRQ